MESKHVSIGGKFSFGNDLPLVLIAGPCQIESMDHSLMIAEWLKRICNKLSVNLVYKSSFDKANRTSLNAKRGVGLSKAIEIFAEIKKQFALPILTDIHTEEQCRQLADKKEVDILQIPAFLCRQTDLLIAASQSNKIVNVKKGQFLAPWDMANVANKIIETGNDNVLLTERGASFGYNTLVSDMRSLEIMKTPKGLPVVFDATHSVQQPGGLGGASGGQRQFVPSLAKAATSIGISAVFMEVHQNPDAAPSDGACMLDIKDLEPTLATITKIDKIVKSL